MGDQLLEGFDAGLGGDLAEHPGLVDVVGGEVGQGAAAAVLELDASGAPGCGRLSPVAAVQGLQLRFLIGADHVVVGTQRVALPLSGIQVEHPGGLGAKSGSRGKIQDRCCQGLIASAASQRRTVAAEIVSAIPRVITSVASSVLDHRDNGCTGLGGQRAGQRLDLGDLYRREPTSPPAARPILEPRQARGREPAAPLTDGVHVHTHLGGDLGVAAPVGRREHDPRANHVAMRRASTTGPGHAEPTRPGGST